jgi:hypothetical protein
MITRIDVKTPQKRNAHEEEGKQNISIGRVNYVDEGWVLMEKIDCLIYFRMKLASLDSF